MGKTFSANSEIELGNGFKILCEASGKQVVVDEPVSFGGTDLGMNPIELLLSSLGACKCVIAKVLAKKKGIVLEHLSVECTGSFNRDSKAGLSEIKSVYNIKSDMSADELEKFIELVDKNCPVNCTIKNTPELSSSVKKL